MNHPNPFRKCATESPPSARRTWRWLATLKIIVVALIVLAIVLLHLVGIIGIGSHLGG